MISQSLWDVLQKVCMIPTAWADLPCYLHLTSWLTLPCFLDQGSQQAVPHPSPCAHQKLLLLHSERWPMAGGGSKGDCTNPHGKLTHPRGQTWGVSPAGCWEEKLKPLHLWDHMSPQIATPASSHQQTQLVVCSFISPH